MEPSARMLAIFYRVRRLDVLGHDVGDSRLVSAVLVDEVDHSAREGCRLSRVFGSVTVSQPCPAPAGSLMTVTIPGRARRSTAWFWSAGLSESSSAAANNSGTLSWPMALLAVSPPPSLLSHSAGDNAMQASACTAAHVPIATAPPYEAPTTASERAPRLRKAVAMATTSAATL